MLSEKTKAVLGQGGDLDPGGKENYFVTTGFLQGESPARKAYLLRIGEGHLAWGKFTRRKGNRNFPLSRKTGAAAVSRRGPAVERIGLFWTTRRGGWGYSIGERGTVFTGDRTKKGTIRWPALPSRVKRRCYHRGGWGGGGERPYSFQEKRPFGPLRNLVPRDKTSTRCSCGKKRGSAGRGKVVGFGSSAFSGGEILEKKRPWTCSLRCERGERLFSTMMECCYKGGGTRARSGKESGSWCFRCGKESRARRRGGGGRKKVSARRGRGRRNDVIGSASETWTATDQADLERGSLTEIKGRREGKKICIPSLANVSTSTGRTGDRGPREGDDYSVRREKKKTFVPIRREPLSVFRGRGGVGKSRL